MYYIRQSGSDSNNGTSAATAWRTIGKALGASGISSGDTVYLGGGATYRESVSVAMTSATAETKVIGDVTGQYTGDAGEVIWSNYTNGDFANSTSTAPCVLNGRDYLTFEAITFVSGNGSCINAGTGSTNLTVTNCTLQAGGNAIQGTATFAEAMSWTISNCRIVQAVGDAIRLTAPTSASGADYNLGVVVRNCLLIGGSSLVALTSSGSATYRGNGVTVDNCTVLGVAYGFYFTGNLSLTYPSIIRNSLVLATSNALLSGTSGFITDGGGNRLFGSSAVYSNVTGHATTRSNSLTSLGFPNIFPIELGQSAVLGQPYRHPLMSYAGNGSYPGGALGFGNVAGGTSTSITGRARPSGSGVILHTGTVTSATSSTLTDSNASFPIDGLKGALVRVNGLVKRIGASTKTQLTISGAAPSGGLWSITPSANDTYIVYQGPQVETGKATAGAATTLTDSGANWATNQWGGYTVEITGGTGTGTATVSSNTATALTVASWPNGTPDNTSTYALYWPGTSLTATQSSAGAFELGDTAKAVAGETGTAIQIDGAGAQDVTVPVTAAATTITVRALFDSNHGTTNKPQAQVLAQPEIGVSLTTATATGAADTWETLTLSFTPTAAGTVTLRFVSRSATPYGYARFDTVTVSP